MQYIIHVLCNILLLFESPPNVVCDPTTTGFRPNPVLNQLQFCLTTNIVHNTHWFCWNVSTSVCVSNSTRTSCKLPKPNTDSLWSLPSFSKGWSSSFKSVVEFAGFLYQPQHVIVFQTRYQTSRVSPCSKTTAICFSNGNSFSRGIFSFYFHNGIGIGENKSRGLNLLAFSTQFRDVSWSSRRFKTTGLNRLVFPKELGKPTAQSVLLTISTPRDVVAAKMTFNSSWLSNNTTCVPRVSQPPAQQHSPESTIANSAHFPWLSTTAFTSWYQLNFSSIPTAPPTSHRFVVVQTSLLELACCVLRVFERFSMACRNSNAPRFARAPLGHVVKLCQGEYCWKDRTVADVVSLHAHAFTRVHVLCSARSNPWRFQPSLTDVSTFESRTQCTWKLGRSSATCDRLTCPSKTRVWKLHEEGTGWWRKTVVVLKCKFHPNFWAPDWENPKQTICT